MKNTQVTSQFLKDNRSNPKTKNLFVENGVLYSYGYHYPLCIKLEDDKYIINKDGYSKTTSIHTNHLIKDIAGLRADLNEVEKNPQQHTNIILMTTAQIKKFIDYVKYSLHKNPYEVTSHEVALMELEGNKVIGEQW